MICDEWGEASFPVPDRFVGEPEATHQEHLSQVTQAQFIAQPTLDDEEYNFCGELDKVEGSANALIEFASASRTTESSIAKRSFPGQFPCLIGLAIRAEWAVHQEFGYSSLLVKIC